MRKLCQGDIFRYINEELNIPQKVMCSIFNQVRQGNMAETRISEIKKGKRKGYKGLKEAAPYCFSECFQGKEEASALQDILDFLHREEIYFPKWEEYKTENFKTYVIRFLEFGLDNCDIPRQEAEEEAELSFTKGDHTPLKSKVLTAIPLIQKMMQNWIFIFLSACIIFLIFLLLNLYRISAVDLFLFVLKLCPGSFSTFTFLLAVSTFFFGLVDAGIAVFSYKARERDVSISWRDVPYIAKYGAVDRIVPGKGRYDLSGSRICYSVFCNLTGTFSAWALYLFLQSFTDFPAFVRKGGFDAMANLDLFFSLLLTFAHSFFLFTRDPMTQFKDKVENPDTLSIDRLHVISNNAHLVFNLSFTTIGIVFAGIYGFSHISNGKMFLSPFFAFMILGIHAYLWFSSCSPYAVDFNAECSGSFLLFYPIVAIFSSLYSTLCFQAGWGVFLLNLVNFCALIAWLVGIFRRGSRSVLPLIRQHKAYFIFYAFLFFLYYFLSFRI